MILIFVKKFADYFIIDIPGVLKPQLIKELSIFYSKNTSEYIFGLMYSVYNLPNIILPIIGGILTDKYGLVNNNFF